MEQTKFEKDLEVYFPDIYNIHILGKKDTKLWTAVYDLLSLIQTGGYGKIEISVQKGFINRITTSIIK